MARATSLLKAFNEHAIPHDGAIIISSIFDSASIYSIYEITLLGSVEKMDRSGEGILFTADAMRVYVLVEPADCAETTVEPPMRGEGRSIPLRFGQLRVIGGKRGERVLVSREPLKVESPFRAGLATGDNFSFIFYRTDDLTPAIRKFMADVLYNDSGLDRDDAIGAARALMETMGKLVPGENDWD
jgi:hypothetical protein